MVSFPHVMQEQDRQCTYNVTQARPLIIVAMEKQKVLLIDLSMHACACVHVGTRLHGRVHAHTCM